ncbi:hypothetical protein B566_EDAN013303, partial [Ephemera danica]
MLAEYFSTTEKFLQAESSNAKVAYSMRPEYGDCAIGYVQLKRDGSNVLLRAAVCPETWTRKKSYNLLLSMDEKKILSVECKDCKGSKGMYNIGNKYQIKP